MKSKKQKSRRQSRAREVWRLFRKNKAAMIGLVVFSLLVLVAIFADFIVPYERGIELGTEFLSPPSAAHPCGTDEMGRDVFARLVHGSRSSLFIGIATSLISLVAGCVLGAVAGYYGGRVDNVIMRVLDVFMCVPSILLALAIVAALGPSLINALIALTISGIPGKARLVRSAILTVADQDYIEAARCYGATDARIMARYIAPNCIGPIIVNATMSMASLILAAASLSFLGMGTQPPTPEWGAMLSDARVHMRAAPYLLYFPGGAILLTALSINLVGDGLRDALDPKLKS